VLALWLPQPRTFAGCRRSAFLKVRVMMAVIAASAKATAMMKGITTEARATYFRTSPLIADLA
jgi:hypothetical protein